MAERVPIPTDAAKVNWATGTTPYTTTLPDATKRDIGFQPKDESPPQVSNPGTLGETITAPVMNALFNLWGLMIAWIRDFVPREFTDLPEAIEETVPGQTFKIYPAGGNCKAVGDSIFSVSPLAGVLNNICMDGSRIYGWYGVYVYAYDPTNGSSVWNQSYTPDTVTCDGGYVYALGCPSIEVKVLDPTDGTVVRDYGTTSYDCIGSDANGYYLAGFGESANPSGLRVWRDIQTASIAQQGTYDHGGGGTLRAVALDHDLAFIGGDQGLGGIDVRAITLSSGPSMSARWSIALPVTAAPTVFAICADGEYCYVSTDRQSLTAGGNATLYCIARHGGLIAWTQDLISDFDGICCDDRYLYVGRNGTATTYIIDKTNGQVIQADTTQSAKACDGISYAGDDTSNGLLRSYRGGPSRQFMRADTEDPDRRPFHNSAILTDI
jgi:hypothetical protein